MTKRIAYFEYGRVYPAPEGEPAHGAPLVGGNPPVAPELEPEDAHSPARASICHLLALLWYITFVAFMAAACIVVIQYPLDGSLFEWPETPVGLVLGFGLCGITALVRGCARRETT